MTVFILGLVLIAYFLWEKDWMWFDGKLIRTKDPPEYWDEEGKDENENNLKFN